MNGAGKVPKEQRPGHGRIPNFQNGPSFAHELLQHLHFRRRQFGRQEIQDEHIHAGQGR
jgi:hypothetical protein